MLLSVQGRCTVWEAQPAMMVAASNLDLDIMSAISCCLQSQNISILATLEGSEGFSKVSMFTARASHC